MKISYIVPSFNHAKYIIDCLDSIKDDSFGNYEIIILDDGSTDQSTELVKSWIANNSQLNVQLIEQANRGICYSLNKLISLSQGDYIRPVASDDQILKGSTQLLVQALEPDQRKVVAFGDAQTMGMNGEKLSDSHIEFLHKNKAIYSQDLKRAVISEWGIAGPVILYRKNFMSTVGPYDEKILIEDWNMYLRLAGLDKLVFIADAVAKYRIHDTNTSRTKNITKRILNLKSQYLGGAQNLQYFVNENKHLLNSELNLINAKVSYLEKSYVAVFTNMYFYAIEVLIYKVRKFCK